MLVSIQNLGSQVAFTSLCMVVRELTVIHVEAKCVTVSCDGVHANRKIADSANMVLTGVMDTSNLEFNVFRVQ